MSRYFLPQSPVNGPWVIATRHQLSAQCEKALDFPRTLIHDSTYPYSLDLYFNRLNEYEDRLFHDERGAALDFSDLDVGACAFVHSCEHNMIELRKKLNLAPLPVREDPRCRFVFVHAPHSREKLKTTRRMLMSVLTYHQVMPAFLDFLFPFGLQEYPQDFDFSGFRQHTTLSDFDRGLTILEVGRSGRGYQLCYSLKAVEQSSSQIDWPWSIRQTAIHHSFDVNHGRANWIIIKGDQLMKNRIRLAIKDTGLTGTSDSHCVDRAFVSTFVIHMVICDWSCESWRWYINFLQEKFQDTTRRTVTSVVEESPSPTAENILESGAQCNCSRGQTSPSMPESRKPRMRASPWSRMSKKTYATTAFPGTRKRLKFEKQEQPSKTSTTVSPLGLQASPTSPCGISDQVESSRSEHSFDDWQQAQFIEEKANDVLLVLKTNMQVLADLRQYYQETAYCEDWPRELKMKCSSDMSRFEKCIAGIEKKHQMQQQRVELLLRSMADRKSLLYGILEYKNMQASKVLAIKAHQSSRNMELIAQETQFSTINMEKSTSDMHNIARKTKQETVSMRIITLVTLFFLPGTFISTLMSTDVVQLRSGSKLVVEMEVLRWYLAISLPLVFVTVLAWYGFYQWETRKEQRKLKNDLLGPRHTSQIV